jgi:hypothetical protein
MSKQDLDDPEVGIIAQEIGSLDLGYGAVPPNYNNISYNGYGADTITIDSSSMISGSITLPTTTISTNTNGYTIGSAGTSGQFYTTTGTGHYNWNNPPTVNISNTGIDMAAGADIKVDGKSLKQFMDNMEERLAILHPNPALEDRWEQLKELRRQYVEMEKDLLEKEKLMKILKES